MNLPPVGGRVFDRHHLGPKGASGHALRERTDGLLIREMLYFEKQETELEGCSRSGKVVGTWVIQGIRWIWRCLRYHCLNICTIMRSLTGNLVPSTSPGLASASSKYIRSY